MGRGRSQTRTLNINKEITCVSAGKLDPHKGHDFVIVGTQTNLFAYDVDNNADVFYKEVPDGINAMVVGEMDGAAGTLAVVGGNCSIQGFDLSGEEQVRMDVAATWT
jgi:Bardet-Biedl syndrome 2 protein